MFYIIGLGNPGTEYEGTRHNIGRDIIKAIAASEHFSSWDKNKNAEALYARGSLGAEPVEFFLPETFMNNSGLTLRFLVQKQAAKLMDIVVVYDDVDLPVGEIKVSVGRGAGGHNGIASIINALGSKDFIRVRIGVASKGFFGTVKRPKGEKLAEHVLGTFGRRDRSLLEGVEEKTKKALQLIVTEGVAVAMNVCNSKMS